MNLAHFPHSIGVISAVEYNTVANLLPGRPVLSLINIHGEFSLSSLLWQDLIFYTAVSCLSHGARYVIGWTTLRTKFSQCDINLRLLLCSSIEHWSQRDYISLASCRFFITEETQVCLSLSFYVKHGPIRGRRFILILMTMTHPFPHLKTGRWNFTVRLTQSQLGLNLVASGGNHSDHVIYIKDRNLHLGFAPAAFTSLLLSFSARVKTVLQLPVTHLPPAPEEENRRSRRKGAGRR